MASTSQTLQKLPRKRRWFRYSLRTCLLVVTLFGLCLGWKFGEAREQRHAVAELLRMQIGVDYDYPNQHLGVEPPEPAWLIKLLGVDFFHDVVGVNNTRFLNGDYDEKLDRTPAFRAFARLPKLRMINLAQLPVNDDDLRQLAGLSKLHVVWFLAPSTATGAGFEGWRSRETMESILLGSSPISDGGIQQIAEFKSLTDLSLNNSEVTDASVDAIARLPKLTAVWLEGAKISPQGARRLQELRPGLSTDIFPDAEPGSK
jgi:hypothetical protein